MAVALPGDRFYPEAGTDCFLCGKSMDDEPVAYWNDAGSSLYLHGGCAGTFVLRLARDAWQIERDAADGEFTLTLRARGWQLPEPS